MSQINLKIEENVKKESEEILNQLGFSMSSAINIFLKTVVREKRIPFSIKLNSDHNSSVAHKMSSSERK